MFIDLEKEVFIVYDGRDCLELMNNASMITKCLYADSTCQLMMENILSEPFEGSNRLRQDIIPYFIQNIHTTIVPKNM